jgi:hypothetical protein
MQKVIKPIKLLFDGFFIALLQGCSLVSLQSEESLESKLWGAQYLIIDSHECPNLVEDCLLAQPVVGFLWRKPTLKFYEPAAIYPFRTLTSSK